jgi:hypothetical protein
LNRDGLAAALGPHGLILRGGFNFTAEERAPPGPSGQPARAALLVGQAGRAAWKHFQRWRQARTSVLDDPLDSWSREVIGTVAQAFGARAVSPSDRPYLPFQQWAMRAEGLRPSPLGILMHPRYGLWHAYRGALLSDAEIAVEPPRAVIHLCDACDAKPCLNACPVEAYSADGFAYDTCLGHLRGPLGSPCRGSGCLDRNACPYGREYCYGADQQAFHMAAFAC